MDKIKSTLRFLLSLVYVNKCLTCFSNAENLICKKCYSEISFLSPTAIQIHENIPIYCACLYEKTVKKLIRKLKFNHRKQASIILAQILFEYFKKLDLKKDFIIVYPPTFPLKAFARGYNHTALIARHFSKLTNFEIEKNLIKKIKYTKPQYQAKNRFKNIKDSFEINKNLVEKYKDKSILFIDDILTSGATSKEIINCLLQAGIKDISAVIIAKAGK